MKTYRVTNPKGETRKGLTAKDVSIFKAALKERGIENPEEAGYKLEEEPENPYEKRKEYFGGGASGALAEVFPNLAEQSMKGNDSYNLGTLRAGVSDMLSLPGRFVSSLVNSSNLGGQGEFNLGARSGEGTNVAGTVLRDPITFATLGAGGALANGVKQGANLGRYVIGKGGRAIGAALTGAAEGAGIEGASALMNDRELTPEGLALASSLGGGFELAASWIQSLLQRFGKNYIKSAAQATRLGNTDREMTDAELIEFLSNERNRNALETVLEKGSSGRNATPFVNDRGKAIQPEVDKSYREAVSVLSEEPALNSGIGTKIENGVTPTEADMQRRKKAFNSTPDEVDVYKDKTVWREGRQNMQDMAYARDYPGEQLFAEPRRSQTKNTTYQSNSEYNLEKFADKYDNIGSQFENAKVRPGEITRDESLLLDELEREIAQDEGIISGYTPQYVIESNKFLGDRVPFNNSFYKNNVVPFLESHPEGVSSEFLGEVRRLTGEATSYGRDVATNVQTALKGKERATLERAFSYADAPEYEVRKGYRDAVDRFADTLSDYSDGRVGEVGTNAKGQKYIVGQENMKKYAYGYLKKVQDILAKKQALSADDVVTLYGEATNVNDTEVQSAILQLLKDLNVPEETVKSFEKIGGNYAMLNKARTRMKTNTKAENPLKGTVLAPIVPQEGFNTTNALGWRAQRENINLNDLSTTNNPSKIGKAARWGVYNLGLPYARPEERR
jgi:hypothetical protein